MSLVALIACGDDVSPEPACTMEELEALPTLRCPAPVIATCTGPRTAVALARPTATSTCATTLGEPSSDAPPAGFPPGATTVTWSAAAEGRAPLVCAVTVAVNDETPPTLDCSGVPDTVVRRRAGDPGVVAPLPTALDGCDVAPEVELAPLPTERGPATLTATATDATGNETSCDFDVTILDVFAPGGLRVISAERTDAGMTDVTLGWEASVSPDVTDVRLERAAAADGPYAELATLPATTTTYTDASIPTPEAYYRLVSLSGPYEGGQTEPVRALSLGDGAAYHLPGRSIPTVPFDTALHAVVRHPQDLSVGPFPLVVFLHGNHGNCRSARGQDTCTTQTSHRCTSPGYTTTPNAEGYVYLMETLASQGYVTVSLSANALNCREDFILERTQLILAHLRQWRTWVTEGGAPFGDGFVDAVDLGRVALVGHSRGGEAVAHAPGALAASPIAGVSLASVFGIGATDYHEPQPSGVPFASLLPGCDADVHTLAGAAHYDRSLDPRDPQHRAQVLYVGANHNYFNSEWRSDDNEGRTRVCDRAMQVGGPAQRAMLEMVLSDWLAATTTGSELPAYVRAEVETPALVATWADRTLDLRWSYSSPGRLRVDDFAGRDAPGTNDLGGSNTYDGLIASLTCSDRCARNYPHTTGSIRLAWQDASATTSFDLRGVDATAYSALTVRVAARVATINRGLSEHRFAVRIWDSAGLSAEVPVRTHNGYPSLAPVEILTTLRVPFEDLLEAEPDLDLSGLSEIEILMRSAGGTTQGSIWVADLDLTD